VNDHDFEQDALGKAVPYGIYDLKYNRGYVYVGQSADTPQFAVEMIVRWWQEIGKSLYPNADKILILADAGGSNGCRPRLWKQQLQELLADQLGIEVTVCHYPTGTSKWNPIEHRLFGPISMNWAGKPLETFEFMLACIRGTDTDTGLQVDMAHGPVDMAHGPVVTVLGPVDMAHGLAAMALGPVATVLGLVAMALGPEVT
jgi:hypothetical protein